MLVEISSQHHDLATRHVQLQAEHAKIDDIAFKAEYDAQVSKSKETSLLATLEKKTREFEDERRVGTAANQISSMTRKSLEMETKLRNMTKSWKNVQV